MLTGDSEMLPREYTSFQEVYCFLFITVLFYSLLVAT